MHSSVAPEGPLALLIHGSGTEGLTVSPGAGVAWHPIRREWRGAPVAVPREAVALFNLYN